MPKKPKTPVVPPNDDELDFISETLTIKQERFCLEYVVLLNGTEAARAAGYGGDDRALASAASRLLRNVKVRARVNELLGQYAMEKHEIIGRLTAQARADMGDFIDDATWTVNMEQAKKRGLTHLIKKVKQTIITKDDTETQIFEFELHDPQAALVHLGKVHALFTDKVRVDDWRSDAIDAIRSGAMTYAEAVNLFDDSLARELFTLAKVPVK